MLRMDRSWIFLISMIIIFVFCRVDLAELNKEVKINKIQTQQLTQQLHQILYKQLQLEGELAQHTDLKVRLKNWQRNLIHSSDLKKLYKQIKKMGVADELQFKEFNTGIETQAQDYVKVPITVTIQGSYQAIAKFFSQVANLPWIVAVSDFSITNDTLMVTAKVTLDVYYLG